MSTGLTRLIYNLQRHELQPGENKILIGIKNDEKWQKKLLSLQVSREEAKKKKKKKKNSGFDVIRPSPPGYNMDAFNLILKIGSKQLGAICSNGFARDSVNLERT